MFHEVIKIICKFMLYKQYVFNHPKRDKDRMGQNV